MAEEKRESPRIATNIEIRFREKSSFVRSYMLNVNKGGLFLKTDKPLNIDAEVILRALRRLHRERGAQDETPGAMLDDVAHLLDRPVEEIRQLLVFNERSASLDAPLDIDADLSMSDSMADAAAEDPAAQLAQHESELLVAEWVAQLTERQRLVIERRYGLAGHDTATLDDIAIDLGLTRERVRQIQMEALSKLRKHIARDGLTPESLL